MPYTPPVPLPGQTTPPAPTDSGFRGDTPNHFAMADHVHPSKVRKERLQSNADGTLVWTFSAPFASGIVPRIQALAETGLGVTDVVNVQVEGTPTNTSANLRVTRTQRSVVSLIGLTVLSLPAQPGATWVHLLATEP